MSDTDLFNHGYLNGADGIKLYYKDTGNPDAPAILFIHGWSQTHAAWIKQFNSELPEKFNRELARFIRDLCEDTN